MDDLLRGLGERIGFIRSSAGISRAELGDRLGVKEGAVGRYERGEIDPGTVALTKIAQIGDVSLDWLLTGKDNRVEGAQEPPAIQSGGMDKELVRVVIEAVEEALRDLHLELRPDKKAQLVITLCEMFEEEKQVDKPTVLRLIKLAA